MIKYHISNPENGIGGVMVSMLASSARGRVKPKNIKLIFAASMLCIHH